MNIGTVIFAFIEGREIISVHFYTSKPKLIKFSVPIYTDITRHRSVIRSFMKIVVVNPNFPSLCEGILSAFLYFSLFFIYMGHKEPVKSRNRCVRVERFRTQMQIIFG